MSRSATLLVKRPWTTVLPSETPQEKEAAGYDSVQGSMGEAKARNLPERDIRLLLMT